MGVYIEVGDTIDSCHKKIFDKFGKQNVNILSTKAIKVGRFFGLFPKDAVEITFLVDEKSYEESKSRRAEKLSKMAISKIDKLNLNEQKQKEQKSVLTNNIPYLNNPTLAQPENDQIQQSQAETLEMMQTGIAAIAERIVQFTSAEPVNEKPSIRKIRGLLEDNAFSPEYVRKVLGYIGKNISLSQEDDFELIQKLALERIAKSIKVTSLKLPEAETAGENPFGMTFSLVGPTGVGKTTTVAKLCAYYFLALAKKYPKKLSVAAVTIDNYRIGGWEQIEKYCYHMRIPLTVATNADELQQTVNKNRQKFDVIFIDTTGRSPNDSEKIDEMTKYFSGLEDKVEFFLAINASTQASDIDNIIDAYSDFDYSSIIVTKADEASSFGSLISAMDKTDIPISYITTGQNVPLDIQRAGKTFFLKKLIGFENLAEYVDETFTDKVETEIKWE